MISVLAMGVNMCRDLVRPPGTVVPSGLMFYCWCFFLFVSGTLLRYISELPRPFAVKLSDMIGSVWT